MFKITRTDVLVVGGALTVWGLALAGPFDGLSPSMIDDRCEDALRALDPPMIAFYDDEVEKLTGGAWRYRGRADLGKLERGAERESTYFICTVRADGTVATAQAVTPYQFHEVYKRQASMTE